MRSTNAQTPSMPLDPYLCTYSQRFPHHRTVCPHRYLRDILTRIGEHPINRIDELLPWNIARQATQSVAA